MVMSIPAPTVGKPLTMMLAVSVVIPHELNAAKLISTNPASLADGVYVTELLVTFGAIVP